MLSMTAVPFAGPTSFIMSTAIPAKRPDYGIDAPPVIRNLFLLAAAALIIGLVFHFILITYPFYFY